MNSIVKQNAGVSPQDSNQDQLQHSAWSKLFDHENQQLYADCLLRRGQGFIGLSPSSTQHSSIEQLFEYFLTNSSIKTISKNVFCSTHKAYAAEEQTKLILNPLAGDQR
jgi:hypothetical protein